jgi:hypothetical protein
MTQGRKLDEKERSRIESLIRGGLTTKAITQRTGLCSSAVNMIKAKMKLGEK